SAIRDNNGAWRVFRLQTVSRTPLPLHRARLLGGGGSRPIPFALVTKRNDFSGHQVNRRLGIGPSIPRKQLAITVEKLRLQPLRPRYAPCCARGVVAGAVARRK